MRRFLSTTLSLFALSSLVIACGASAEEAQDEGVGASSDAVSACPCWASACSAVLDPPIAYPGRPQRIIGWSYQRYVKAPNAGTYTPAGAACQLEAVTHVTREWCEADFRRWVVSPAGGPRCSFRR